MRIALSLGLAALFLTASIVGAADKPKYTTKEVMKLVNGRGKLRNKIINNGGKDATDEDKQKILELYEAMAQNPTKGDPADWKKLNDAIIKATKDVIAGKEGSIETFKKVTDCRDCHDRHKAK